MASLASSPKGAPVRQGLEFIEYAHRLGGAKLKLASAGGPPSGKHFRQLGMCYSAHSITRI